MDIREILNNIEAAIAANSACCADPQRAAQIRALTANHQQNKPLHKALNANKQKLARQFKQVDKQSPEFEALKLEMQSASQALKSLQAEQKTIEKQLLAILAAPETEDTLLPKHFAQQSFDNKQPTSQVQVAVWPPQAKTGLQNADCSQEQLESYIDTHPNAFACQQLRFQETIKASFGHQSFFCVAQDEQGKVCGALPLTILQSRLFGRFAVSVPFFNYGGPLADSSEIASRLMEAAASAASAMGLSHVEIRALQKINDWPVKSEKVSMLLALPDQQTQLDKELGSKIRAQLKQAESQDMVFSQGGSELLDDFYSVFARHMRDLGTPVYSKQFFRELLERDSKAFVATLKKDGKAIAAAVLLGHRDCLEIPWASTLREANRLNANMLLYRKILGVAIDKGYRYFDFGRSTRDANTFRFKKQWGAKPVEHYWHYWMAEGGEPPSLNPNNPKYRLAITLWQKLPVWLTRIIGPPIVKNLP